MIIHYFNLMFKILNRKLTDFGLPVLVGYLLIFSIFFFGSDHLFNNFEKLKFKSIYLASSFILSFRLSDVNKINYLKTHLTKINVFKIRCLENIIISIPFLSFLLFKGLFQSALILLIINCLLPLLTFKSNFKIVIPTPFSKYPYEYIIGFRKSFLLCFFSYLLTFISIYVRNINLGIFSLILIFFICMSFYSIPEKSFYIAIYSCDSKTFLKKKIETLIKCTLIMTLPISLFLMIFFLNDILLIFFFQIIGFFYVITSLLSKYSVFPSKISIQEGLIIFFSITMPPILLISIPYYYKLSKSKVKKILE